MYKNVGCVFFFLVSHSNELKFDVRELHDGCRVIPVLFTILQWETDQLLVPASAPLGQHILQTPTIDPVG